MSHILIAGCGRLGRQTGERLQTAGHAVTGLRRSATDAPFLMLQQDMAQPFQLPSELTPVDYLIYTASADARQPEAYQSAYVDGFRHCLEALKSHPVQHVLFVSSTAVYGQSRGEWVDETSPTEPSRFNGQIMLTAEQVPVKLGMTSTAVRFGGIYSGDRRHLLRSVAAGKTVQAEPPRYTNRIHESDCAGVLAFLLMQHMAGKALASCYVAVDTDPAPEHVVAQWLAAQLDAPAPVIDNSDPQSQNKRCCSARLQQLGFQFEYPDFRSGYGAMLAEQEPSE